MTIMGAQDDEFPMNWGRIPSLFTQRRRKEEFSEVQGSKHPIRRSGKHSTTAWRHPLGVKTRRLGTFCCTFVCQGVTTRNGATTREILAHRTGAQPNFALSELCEVRSPAKLGSGIAPVLVALSISLLRVGAWRYNSTDGSELRPCTRPLRLGHSRLSVRTEFGFPS